MGSGGTRLWRDWDVRVVRCLGQGREGKGFSYNHSSGTL